MKNKNGQLVELAEEEIKKEIETQEQEVKKEKKNDWGDILDFLKDSLSRRDRDDY